MMMGQNSGAEGPLKDMASLATTRSDTPNSGGKQIPLLCSVCPETPRFSDVSHLLTHIASKGHLHHETQMKLKSHQDISASVAMQQYEQWYRENGIEALLVDRMRAKQLKEAARGRRPRGALPMPPPKPPKRKARRSVNKSTRVEQEEFPQDFPIFPGLFPPDHDPEMNDEFVVRGDMLSLKGQVWPGMGKMDLANEDMRRTRNQRKPSSVIERMKRTSEGIEPTQVVMTSEFEVERIKGVYDDTSSPSPSHEETTSPPRKITKTKRMRASTALTEISGNVPRGGNGRATRGTLAHASKIPKPKRAFYHDVLSSINPSLGPFKHGRDIFRDDDAGSVPYEGRSYSTPTRREQRFDLQTRDGIHPLNPISHSSLVSPTPSSRDLPFRLYPTREAHRGRGQGQPYLNHGSHLALGSFNNPESPYSLHEPSMYHTSGRLPFNAGNHFSTMNHENYHHPTGGHLQPKQEEFVNSASSDPLSNAGSGQFLNMPGTNPLFSQDHMVANPYSQTMPSQPLSSLSFTPINNNREHSHGVRNDQEQRPSGSSGIKIETQICETLDNVANSDTKDSRFNANIMWDSQGAEHDVELHNSLNSEELDL